MTHSTPRQGCVAPLGHDSSDRQIPDWLARWYKPPSIDPDPFAEAQIRMFIRRNAGQAALDAVRDALSQQAHGRWAMVPFGRWTAVDLASEADRDLLRLRFPHLLDGWQTLSRRQSP